VNRSGQKKPDSRLPRWTWFVIVIGGVLAYVGVGILLEGPRFAGNLDNLWQRPEGADPETVAPYVLLIIPAVLGAIWTRDTFRVIFKGLRRGDAPATIAKDVALFALSFVVLILVALFSSSRRSSY